MSANNIQDYLNQLDAVDSVYYAEKKVVSDEFESFYLNVRKSEKRLLSDDEVATLPVLNNNPHSNEWKKRARSAKRLSRYFGDNKTGSLLDLGCGNGWFTALLAENIKLEILGIDVNLTELKQGARVFQKSNLYFIYGDVFQSQYPKNIFDFISINAVIQYFENLDLLIEKLFGFLKPGGEIHIIDSPFYYLEDLTGAKQRTIEYYGGRGFPEMSQYYFHHSWAEISKFNPILLYDPKRKNKFLKFIKKSDMPFPWIKIVKKDG